MMQDFKYVCNHLLVGAASYWCMYNSSWEEWHWVYGTYGTLTVYSILGTCGYGSEILDEVEKLYARANKFVMAFALPCFVTNLYLHRGFESYVALPHAAVSLIPITLDLVKDQWEQKLMDCILGVNIISGILLCVTEDNFDGIAACLSYLVTHFFITEDVLHIPQKLLYNAGLTVFLFFAFRALHGEKIM